MSSNNTPIPAEGSMELVPQFRADDNVVTIASALLEQGLVVVHRGVEFADALTADGAFDQILDTTKASGGGGSFLPSNTKRTRLRPAQFRGARPPPELLNLSGGGAAPPRPPPLIAPRKKLILKQI